MIAFPAQAANPAGAVPGRFFLCHTTGFYSKWFEYAKALTNEDGNGINYGIALVPEGMAGPMNSVEVIGFAIANVVSGEEQLAAYRFIGWWPRTPRATPPR